MIRTPSLRSGLLALAALSVACSRPSTGPSPAPAPAPTSNDPAPAINVVELTVAQIQADYAAHKYTAVQLTRAYLARIALYEDHYNAFISMNPNALATAAELDKEFAKTGPRGPLHGVPVVIKDNIDFGGLLTTAGFAGFSKATGGIDMIPEHDAEAVARLKKAGAIVLGKTNMPDFAGNGTYSKSTIAGMTLNPYADDREPGGSSGGSATAVNASFAVMGFGTETGGSIQNPSSAQALVGVKPTFGLVPTSGVVPIDATYRDVLGPLARSVMDAATALDVIAGPSPKDLASYASVGKMPAKGYVAALSTTSLAGKRFGLVGVGWRRQYVPLAPETDKIYKQAIAALKARGAEVVEDPFLNSGWVEAYAKLGNIRPGSVNAHDMFVYMQDLGATTSFHSPAEWQALCAKNLPPAPAPAAGAAATPPAPGGRGGGTPTGCEYGGQQLRISGAGTPVLVTATEAGDAFGAWRKDMRTLFRKVMTDHRLDGLFFPQAGAPISKRVGDATPNDHPEIPSNIINDVGLPTVTLPFAYYGDGTPFTLAFIGDMWTDDKLLSWAYDLEQATHGRVPPKLVPAAAAVRPPGH